MLVGPHLSSSGKDRETNNIGYNERNYSKVQELLIQDQTDDSLQIKAELRAGTSAEQRNASRLGQVSSFL